MQEQDMTTFVGGLGIGQAWRISTGLDVCRVVTIDPALHLVDFEDVAGHIESDTIEHFLSTHRAEAC
jgi:hypothetical protein